MPVTIANHPSRRAPLVSVVTPAFREEKNLPVLHDRLQEALRGLDISWEWIIIDDHSPDGTFSVATALSKSDRRVRTFRFSRNFGSHAGITCGLHQARGEVVAILAGDLQDPPELLPDMLAKWRAGARVVWAVRAGRKGEGAITVMAARLYYWLLRRFVGLKTLPPEGADFLILDRVVVDAIKGFAERNVSIFALMSWIGFSQDAVTYEKQPRLHGRSGWTFAKKFKLLVDSVTAFSFGPIRFMSWFGLAMAVIGFAYALFVIVNALVGHPIEGWASLMVAVLVIGGLQMMMLGVVGEYVWRGFDEARGRPLYIIEDRVDNAVPSAVTDEVRPGRDVGSSEWKS